jgi:uncharacterized Zn-binding protein involved in type VI secretion
MIPILTAASSVQCPHGGQALLLTSNTQMLIDGAPALMQSDLHAIIGCPFAAVAPSPCITIRWITGAAQCKVGGVPVLLQNSVGLCLNALQAPQGPALVLQVQQKAKWI